jgi:hypothetical protein
MKDRELLIRAVRWARLPGYGHTVPQALKKFGLTQSEWRKAARELAWEARLSCDEDIFLAALHPKGLASVQSVIDYYDWVNHAGISPKEVHAVMARLIKQGWVKRVGDSYQLAREWP